MQGTRVDNLLGELRAHMPQLEKACVLQQRPSECVILGRGRAAVLGLKETGGQAILEQVTATQWDP